MKKLCHFVLLFSWLMLFSAPAKASEWGCQVLLCLANPAGPMAAPACVPPIKKLFAALSKPKPDPFPTCDEAKSQNGDSFAKQGIGHFDRCPAGTAALAPSVMAIQITASTYQDLVRSNPAYFGTDLQASTKAALATMERGMGIGEGDGLMAGPDEGLPSKVCVGGELGQVRVPGASADDYPYVARAFERVVTLPPAALGRYIDIYVNGRLFNRVRY